MRTVVAAVIERADRRLLIGQRRREDSSPLKWEFPGGKVRNSEKLEEALARELREELGVTLTKSREVASVRHQYGHTPEELEIHFFAAAIAVNLAKGASGLPRPVRVSGEDVEKLVLDVYRHTAPDLAARAGAAIN